MSKHIIIVFTVIMFLLGSMVFAQYQSPFDRINFTQTLQNILSAKITMPQLAFSSGGQVSVIGLLAFYFLFFSLIYAAGVNIPVFTNQKRPLLIFSLTFSAIIVLSTNFIFDLLGLMGFITTWGFIGLWIIAIIALWWFVIAMGYKTTAFAGESIAGSAKMLGDASIKMAQADQAYSEAVKMHEEARQSRVLTGQERAATKQIVNAANGFSRSWLNWDKNIKSGLMAMKAALSRAGSATSSSGQQIFSQCMNQLGLVLKESSTEYSELRKFEKNQNDLINALEQFNRENTAHDGNIIQIAENLIKSKSGIENFSHKEDKTLRKYLDSLKINVQSSLRLDNNKYQLIERYNSIYEQLVASNDNYYSAMSELRNNLTAGNVRGAVDQIDLALRERDRSEKLMGQVLKAANEMEVLANQLYQFKEKINQEVENITKIEQQNDADARKSNDGKSTYYLSSESIRKFSKEHGQ